MKRVIKFRAWDLHYKIMSPVTHLDFVTDELDCEHNMGEPKMMYHFILMQFTGLHDRTKTDLYDGDIYEHNGKKFVVIISDNYGTCSVEANRHYDYGMRVIKNGNNRRDFMDIYNIQKYISIVGNIHENPELLNPTK